MITIEINDTEANRALNRLAAGLADMTPAMQEIAVYLVVSTKDRFATGAAPDGTPWAPKSATTMEAYRRRGDRVDPRPLFGPTGMLGRQIFATAGRDWVEWGSPMIYAGTMQFGAAQGQFGRTSRGGPIPWGHIPARPFLGISPADEVAIPEIIAEYLDGLADPR